MPDLDEFLERMWEELSFDRSSFGLDDWGSLLNTVDQIKFLPIADLEKDEFTFHGLLLCNSEDSEDVPCYRRIGFACLSSDGNIAGSGFYVDGWTSPPWPDEELQMIRLK
jgi:hypothetical protein